MLLDFLVAPLRAGQPPGNDVVGRAIALRRRDVFERFTCSIELAKTKGGGGKVKMAVEILWLEAGDLRAPRYGLRPVLFFACLRQNIKCGDRIRASY
jgi:hypothetical protein